MDLGHVSRSSRDSFRRRAATRRAASSRPWARRWRRPSVESVEASLRSGEGGRAVGRGRRRLNQERAAVRGAGAASALTARLTGPAAHDVPCERADIEALEQRQVDAGEPESHGPARGLDGWGTSVYLTRTRSARVLSSKLFVARQWMAPDFQFWTSLAVNAAIGSYGIYLQRRQLRVTAASDGGTVNVVRRVGLSYPSMAILILLMGAAWIPYFLGAIGGSPLRPMVRDGRRLVLRGHG